MASGPVRLARTGISLERSKTNAHRGPPGVSGGVNEKKTGCQSLSFWTSGALSERWLNAVYHSEHVHTVPYQAAWASRAVGAAQQCSYFTGIKVIKGQNFKVVYTTFFILRPPSHVENPHFPRARQDRQ